ncbi:hypothetical protein JTE90_020236 [Oedothorax gibbosus]|uniref:Integrator complex subunit 12 n=1 Tax=Oedothorax gibbosus TaxID=931172 RepID=A0AAV6V0D5_9ARAC|nr:hypothetical protein JTE90_020236 [Oedothorax gibbosus]
MYTEKGPDHFYNSKFFFKKYISVSVLTRVLKDREMASTELDPLFVKGLRLLHSKSKDSTDQLKQLLDDVIAQSKQGTAHPKDRLYTSIKVEGESKIHIKKASRETSESSSYSSKYSSEESRERKAEKRHIEKAKQESIEVEAKIPKLEPPQVYSYYPSSPDLPKLDQYVPKKEDDTDSSEENADADDFAMEMGLACVICKQLDVTQGNQLIECQECHSLYHQECHRPPATDYDYNDPRRVWYCAKCVKNMKKMATKTQKTVKPTVAVSAKEPVSTSKSTRSEGAPPAAVLPFKRSELKPSISSQGNNNQSSTNKPIGLAGLAANFGGGRIATSSSSTTLAPATRGSKATTSAPNQKPAATFTSFATTSSKTTSIATASSLLSKTTVSSSYQSNLTSSTASSASAAGQKPTTPSSSPMKGLGLLSVAAATSSAATTRSAASAQAPSAAAGGGNGNHKPPSCSPLMSADKRLQIMKKKASKMQERRRLSNK